MRKNLRGGYATGQSHETGTMAYPWGLAVHPLGASASVRAAQVGRRGLGGLTDRRALGGHVGEVHGTADEIGRDAFVGTAGTGDDGFPFAGCAAGDENG